MTRISSIRSTLARSPKPSSISMPVRRRERSSTVGSHGPVRSHGQRRLRTHLEVYERVAGFN